MIIKLTPKDIVSHWEIIKYAMVRGDLITPDQRPAVLNGMLHDLLCESAQCFMRFDSEVRKIQAILITKIHQNKRTLERFLYIQCIYSFLIVDEKIWQSDWDFVAAFARKVKCESIKANSANPRIFEILMKLGVKESYRTFTYNLNRGVL